MIGLVDANNFYVSCERVFNPTLESKPVGVMSNNDGCVIARSAEMKAMEIPMGTPSFQLEGLRRRGEIHLLSSNYELYGDMSARLAQLLRDACPDVAPYSIDEMFIYLDGFSDAQCQTLGEVVRRRIRRYLGLPVCVGLAPTHTLAKLANHVAKKQVHYQGVCLLAANSPTTAALLKQLPVNDVWGIGRRIAERLAVSGIRTAWQLRECDPKQLRKRFSVVLARTALELRGTSCLEMNALEQPRQRIMTSRSFGQATGVKAELHAALRRHAQRSAEKLRQQKSLTRAVLLFLTTNRHRKDQPQFSPSAMIPLASPSDDTRIILEAIREGLEQMYRPGFQFMKAGVMLLDLVDAQQYQLSLLQPSTKTHPHLMNTVDAINQRMGQGTIRFGMTEAEAPWQLRCAHRSNRYTTCWDELMEAGTHPGAIAAARMKREQQQLARAQRLAQPRA
ncbi:Y-family DNA polymerase [Halomonas sp. TD01]|uniref:Y-family DNA polymerase n=1 Tax=Halomonas sp. TD01 TaxID=999141 RepID=UPI000214EF24|nr:Y-family DNA polymerase [Halomonas sp. TD01]EGP20405.1 DNA-directed DNA polymerase [Halomonas sp. TD01]CAH1045353.1 Error-prone, lesion bypass DNA polymerase V (UmuC) [Halomonas sp. TD01]